MLLQGHKEFKQHNNFWAASDLFYGLWKKEFRDYDAARMGKQFYYGPDKLRAKQVLALSRGKLSRFIRIISGHNSLFYFRSLVDPDISPTCRFCLETDETFFHIINECPRFISARRDILRNEPVGDDHQWTVSDLLSFSFLPGVNDALEGDTRLELFGRSLDDSGADSDSDS